MPLAIFDLDGTLVYQESAAREWAQGFARTWGLMATDCDLIASSLTQRRPRGEVFAELVQRFEVPVKSSAVWADYRARMPGLVRSSDEDRAALRDLRSAGWTLGIATNGMADNQVGKIRSTGLSGLVDGWVVSSEIGVRKPDLEIFRELARRVGVPLTGWMIGDSLEMDVAGGANAGLQTAWISVSASLVGDVVPTITAPTVPGMDRTHSLNSLPRAVYFGSGDAYPSRPLDRRLMGGIKSSGPRAPITRSRWQLTRTLEGDLVGAHHPRSMLLTVAVRSWPALRPHRIGPGGRCKLSTPNSGSVVGKQRTWCGVSDPSLPPSLRPGFAITK